MWLRQRRLLARGCVLKNTTWVLAAVVYVGSETKARLNKDDVKASEKTSNMQANMQHIVSWILVIGCSLCLHTILQLFAGAGTLATGPRTATTRRRS